MNVAEMSKRLIGYGCQVISLTAALPKTASAQHVSIQLFRAATSIGANYEEAQGAESRLDFIHKLQLAIKECRETTYWLHLLDQSRWEPRDKITACLNESLQLRAMLSKAVVTAKSR